MKEMPILFSINRALFLALSLNDVRLAKGRLKLSIVCVCVSLCDSVATSHLLTHQKI